MQGAHSSLVLVAHDGAGLFDRHPNRLGLAAVKGLRFAVEIIVLLAGVLVAAIVPDSSRALDCLVV